MAPKREITVAPSEPMPKGYAFLPKGNQYNTLHCRRLTHEVNRPLFVVKSCKTVMGIRVPKSVFFQVQTQARETLSTRRAVTEQRDAALVRQAATELRKQFPRIPDEERETILKHGFRKFSGRVGRTSLIPLSKKVLFAVIAHIRHKHTEYDKLMGVGMDRDEARGTIAKGVQGVLQEWGAKPGKFSPRERICAD